MFAFQNYVANLLPKSEKSLNIKPSFIFFLYREKMVAGKFKYLNNKIITRSSKAIHTYFVDKMMLIFSKNKILRLQLQEY